MNNDLISREELKNNIVAREDHDVIGCHGRLYLPVDLVAAALEKTTIVEAEPVIHARWKESDFIPGMLTCTNCGVQRNPKFKLGGGTWNRCPNCGAKMDLEG